MLFWILLLNFLISLISFIGVLTLTMKEKTLQKMLLFLVSLATGALMGGAFLHLIPESLEKIDPFSASSYVLLGFILFFFLEKLLWWRHCHFKKCPIHTFGYLNLVGDGIHNFTDGLIVAASFLSNFSLGIATSLAVALHEIPQEIGDFGVLVYAGFKRKKALLLNFICALAAILGGLFGYLLRSFFFHALLLPFAAGGFIYIAASDLIPEIRKERELKPSLLMFFTFLLGITLMAILRR